MTKEELSKWFWNKFNSCYSVNHKDFPECIFMVYNKSFDRQKKLERILDVDIAYPTKITGTILFKIDYKFGFLWCNRTYIWSFLEDNYINNHNEIQTFISNMLKENSKLDIIIPVSDIEDYDDILLTDTKFGILIPIGISDPPANILKYQSKLKILK